jgi:methionyl-tRNA synthetase
MVGRYRDGKIPAPGETGPLELDLRLVVEEAKAKAESQLREWDLNGALDSIWTIAKRANQYLEERQPWRQAKQPDQSYELDTTLWSAAEATRILAILLAPYIPTTADRILDQLGLEPVAHAAWKLDAVWEAAEFGQVRPAGPLFPRIEVPV